MYWDVIEAKPEQHLILSVRFEDGTQGQVKFTPKHLVGVFEPLKDPTFFSKVFVNDGVVTWPGELDLAPDAMYDEIKQHGLWLLN